VNFVWQRRLAFKRFDHPHRRREAEPVALWWCSERGHASLRRVIPSSVGSAASHGFSRCNHSGVGVASKKL